MRLYQKGIRFRVPFPEVTHQNGVLTAAAPYPGAVIRYTADGNEPTCFSPLYTGEIKTEQPENYRFKTFLRRIGEVLLSVSKSTCIRR
ncbi:MAG: chitobiase/beta-hexosaminidase C-terminal domain-containing protein [Odoribacter splanchnicus]